MPKEPFDAVSSFARGRRLFDSFLETGNVDDLAEAAKRFALSFKLDPKFDVAKFYRAVALISLGSTAEAIGDLKDLATNQPRFRLDALVQLAHAYARNRDYQLAQGQFEEAKKEAGTDRRLQDKRFLIDAYSASLKAAQGTQEQKSDLLKEALALAQHVEENISGTHQIAVAARFEAKMALGTVHLSFYCDAVPGKADEAFKKAEDAFLAARALRPNSPRALYDMGMLYMYRADRDPASSQKEAYEAAKSLISQSLAINRFDDVVRLTEALLHCKTGEQEKAKDIAVRPEWGKWLERFKEKPIKEALSELVNVKDLRSTLLNDIAPPRARTQDC
jgi:tetratricopeptide (TPR) repeat protein